MRRSKYAVVMTVLAGLTVLAMLFGCASAPPSPTPKPTTPAAPATTPAASPKPAASPTATAAPAKSPLPEVPIKYATDTDATIIRRAQWVEAAKKEGTISWRGATSATELTPVIAEFAKVYPFIKVDYSSVASADLEAQLQAQLAAGKMMSDIMLGIPAQNYPLYRKLAAFESFTSLIPGLEKWDKRNYSKSGDWATFGPNTITPAYNTNLVKGADVPKTWDDLLGPKWKGQQVGVNTLMKVWLYLAVEDGGWGVDKTEAFLKKLAEQKPVYKETAASLSAALVAGEFSIAAEMYLYYHLSNQKKGAPYSFAKVSPAIVSGSSISMMAKAAHPNAARLFLEWVTSPVGQQKLEELTGKGDPTPGSGTQAAQLTSGMTLIYRTEEGELKIAEMGLYQRLAKAVGIMK